MGNPPPLHISPNLRLLGAVIFIGALLLLLAAGFAIPFFYESTTMLYKFGMDKTLLRAGKLAGIGAVLLLAAQLITAGRLVIMDRIFGLNSLFSFHRINGMLILGLTITHLLLILVPEGIDNLPLGKKYLAEMIGMLIVLMILPTVLVALKRIRLKLPYHIWLPLHRWTGFILVPLAFFHVRLVSDPFSSGIPLYALAGVISPMLLLGCRRLIYVLFPSWDWRVEKILSHSDTIHSLHLKPERSRSLFPVPGQFVFLRLDSKALTKEEHPFSISSGPDENPTLTIRSCGDWTDKIEHIGVGTRASLSAPFGQFSYILHRSSPGLLFIAGGIGITPFMSMLNHLAAARDTRPIHLLWSFRRQSDCIFQDQLSSIKQQLPNLALTFHCTNPEQGGSRLRYENLITISDALPKGSAAYLCGPGIMVKNLRSSLLQLGFSRRNIHYEYFTL